MARDFVSICQNLGYAYITELNLNHAIEIIRLAMVERLRACDIDIEGLAEGEPVTIGEDVITIPEIIKSCVINRHIIDVQPHLERLLPYILSQYVDHTLNDLSGLKDEDILWNRDDYAPLLNAVNQLYYSHEDTPHWTELIRLNDIENNVYPNIKHYGDWTRQTLQIMMLCRWRIGNLWDCRKKSNDDQLLDYPAYYNQLPSDSHEYMEVRCGLDINHWHNFTFFETCGNANYIYYIDTWYRHHKTAPDSTDKLYVSLFPYSHAEAPYYGAAGYAINLKNSRGKFTAWYPQTFDPSLLGVDAYVDIYVKGICESNNSEASYETYRDMYPVPVPKDTYSLFESGVFLEYDYDNYDPYNYSYIKKEGNCVLELSKPICHKTYGTTIGSTAYPFPVYKYNFKFRDWATDDRYAYHLGGNWHDDNADGMMEAPEGWGCGGSYDIDVSINEV